MSVSQQVSLLKTKDASLPLGTTKKVQKLTMDYEFGFIQGAGLGLVAGLLTSWGIAYGITGNPIDMLATFTSLAPALTLPAGMAGLGTGLTFVRYVELKSQLRTLRPGFTFKRGLSLKNTLPSFKEKRDIVYLESQFGRSPQEIAIVREREEVWVEYLTQRPAGEVWDESIASVKALYNIQPKPKDIPQKTEVSIQANSLDQQNNYLPRLPFPRLASQANANLRKLWISKEGS
jgi:hypothetical protein